MKIKTKDKIAYLTLKTNSKAKFWKELSRQDDSKVNFLFECAKNGDTLRIKDGQVQVSAKLPGFKGMNFSQLSAEKKCKDEEFISKTSLEIINYIEKFDLAGACMTIPYFYKMFLEERNIIIDVEYGIFEHEKRFSVHSWNKYDGKLIDLTANLQKENISGNAIVMGKILRKGRSELIYHRADALPSNYISLIEGMVEIEENINNTQILNDEISYINEMLDTDTFLCIALRKNMNSVKTIKEQLLPNCEKEYQHFNNNFAIKFPLEYSEK